MTTCGARIAGRISEVDPDYTCEQPEHDDEHAATAGGGYVARWLDGLSDLRIERAAGKS